MDKDDGMKEGDDVYGTTGWWGKLGEVEEDSHGAPRGGGAGQCFVVYTHTYTYTYAHNIQCQCHERRLRKIGSEESELWEKAREEEFLSAKRKQKEPPAIVANTGMKPGGVRVGRTSWIRSLERG